MFPDSVVTRIVDGDTFYATVTRSFDFGFHVTTTESSTQRFRLNGCNAAPDNTPSGAGAWVALGALMPPDIFCTIASLGPYKYGDEWMADVTLPDGRDVTVEMIAEQWAAAWNGKGAQPLPPWPRTVSP